MAPNFKVSIHRINNGLYVELRGDFDGTSAQELLHLLRKKCQEAETVFIDTDGLGNVYPFGREMLHKNLHVLGKKPIRFVFTGAKASKISPEQIQGF